MMTFFRNKETFLLSLIFILAVLLRLSAFSILPRHDGPDASEYKFVAENIISWFKGIPIEDPDQFLKVAERRGWLYSLLISLLYSVLGHEDIMILRFQIFLDSLSCILIYLIGRKTFSHKSALLAAFLAATYPGLIFCSNLIGQETTITFLLVYFVYVFTAIEKHATWKNHLAIGLLLGLITIYRPAYQFFFLLFLPIFTYYLKKFHPKNWLHLSTACVTGVMIVIVGWLTFYYTVHKQIILYKSSSWALYETLHNDGWVTDNYFPVVDDNLYQMLSSLGYTPPPKGQQLSFGRPLPSSAYLKLCFNWIQHHPLETVSQMFKRIYRMWFYIETYPGKWHDIPTGIQLFLHRFLVISALAGITFFLFNSRIIWVLYLLIAYANLQITVVGIPRYAVPSMPFILLLASFALVFLTKKFKGAFLPLNGKSIFCICGLILSLLLFNLPNPKSIGILLWMVPSLHPEGANTIRILTANMFFLIFAVTIYLYLIRQDTKKKAASKAVLFVVLTLPVLNSVLITDKTWHEWWCKLGGVQNKVVQEIYIPQELKSTPFTAADLFIDLMDSGGEDYTFTVSVNGHELKSFKNGLRADREKFSKRFFGFYEYFFFNSYRLRPEDLRQWYRFSLDTEVLKADNPLVIECRMERNSDSEDNYVYIFGDFITEHQKINYIFEGPSIPSSNHDTSLYKIMPYGGDARFDTTVKLQSYKVTNFLCTEERCRDDDLSDDLGIQNGRFRILIRLDDGEKQIFL